MQQMTNATVNLRKTSGHAEAYASYGYWMITSDSPAVTRGVWNVTKTFMVCACTFVCAPVLRIKMRACYVCMALMRAVPATSEHARFDCGIPERPFGGRCGAHHRRACLEFGYFLQQFGAGSLLNSFHLGFPF
eukprot:Tamp_14759.p1 GENE.Tamp_14759~~Tamp_14759.p1  ORF type:complete len:133 (-),score=13.04 Tamp_14759:974-1372(-)